MPTISCPVKITGCPCDDSPIENLSSEDIDRRVFRFVLFTTGSGNDGVFVGTSEESEEEARIDAECQAFGCLGAIEPTRICAETFYFEQLVPEGVTIDTWSVSSGALPPGITFDSSDGTLSGIPTTAGAYSFQIMAITSDHYAILKTYSLTVVEITTDSPLPDGELAVAYLTVLAQSGGLATVQWAVVAGTLPPGLNLDADTGAISGVPSVAGTYSFTIEMTDENAFTP